MYWRQAKGEVTIHSGKLKFEGKKVYHPHVSNDLSCDQSFVFVTLNVLLSDADIDSGTMQLKYVAFECCLVCIFDIHD